MSATVLSVLHTKQVASFNEIADDVLHVLAAASPDEQLNERTITRRVYDVLNVFAAAGFISKDMHAIRVEPEGRFARAAQNSGQIRTLKSQLAVQEATLVDKARLLLCYRLLIQRNKSRQAPLAAFELPVLCLAIRDTDGGQAIRSLNGNRLEIATKSRPTFYSPMELFRQLDFSTESQIELTKQIPEIAVLEPLLFPNGAAGERRWSTTVGQGSQVQVYGH